MRDSFFLPLVGGGRSQNIEILSVTPPDGLGTAEIVGDLFRFKAGPGLEAQPIGIPIPFPVTVSYLDGTGKQVDTAVILIAENRPEGVQLTLPGGQLAQDSALVSPIPVEAQFTDPFTFETPPLTQPIVIDESVFVDLFNARNPEFLEKIQSTQAAVFETATARALAAQATEDAAAALQFLSDTADARAVATAQRTIADTQAQVLADLRQEAIDATAAFNTALLAQVNAQSALEAAQVQVTVLSSQLQANEAVLAALTVEFLQADAALLVTLTNLGLALPAEQHFNLPGVGPLIESLATQRDESLASVENVQTIVADLEASLEAAVLTQADAAGALALASVALAEAQERLNDIGEVDFTALEEAVAVLEAQAGVSELVAGQLEDVAESQFGVAVPITPGTLDSFALALNDALQNQALADVAAIQAQVDFDAAVQAYNAQIEALPDFEFDFVAAALRFGFEANLGFEFHFNRATDEEPDQFVTTLVYDVDVEFDLVAGLKIPIPVLPDFETPINIDLDIERSGRIEFAGRDRGERPDRGERFERVEAGERLAEFGTGERLGNWADSFDFL